MQELDRIILIARELNVSDIHMSSGMPLLFRIHGNLTQAPVQPSKEETDQMLYGMLNEKQKEELGQGYDIDFALQTSDGNRQRVNVFCQQGEAAATIRLPVSYTHLTLPTIA